MSKPDLPLDRDQRGQGTIANALTVDIEDWFQVGAFETVIARGSWDNCKLRVADNVARLLDLFAEAGVKATFFTLGWVAEREPAMMRRIVAAGHEVASHGYDHARVFTLTPDQFRADLDRSQKLLEDVSGQRVTGYRAPSFSIDQRTPWAHAILAEKGYHYSSSVAPIRHDHYGWPGTPRFAWKPLGHDNLLEIPVTTVQVAGRTLAAGGGGFFRLLPYALHRWAIDRVHRREGQGVNFYFHPWEIDPAQPRVVNAPIRSKLRHYARLDAMAGKLVRLVRDYPWMRMDEYVALIRTTMR